MKHLKTLLLIAIFIAGFTSVTYAQKIAYINTEKLLSEMPANKALNLEMDKLQKTYKDEIDGLGKKLDAKIKKYQAEAKTQTPEANQKRAVEVQQDQVRISKAQQTARHEIEKKYKEKLTPILKKAEDAIKAVAAEKGIVYVIDATPGKGLIVYEKGLNLYALVRVKLGF